MSQNPKLTITAMFMSGFVNFWHVHDFLPGAKVDMRQHQD